MQFCHSAGAESGVAPKVDIRYLAEHADAYLGKRVLVHACVVEAFHGVFIHPCGSHSKNIVILDFPDSKFALIPQLFFDRLHANYGVEAEADVTGTIARKEMTNTFGYKGTIYVLELQDILNPNIFHKS